MSHTETLRVITLVRLPWPTIWTHKLLQWRNHRWGKAKKTHKRKPCPQTRVKWGFRLAQSKEEKERVEGKQALCIWRRNQGEDRLFAGEDDEPSKQLPSIIYWKHSVHQDQITVEDSGIFCHQIPARGQSFMNNCSIAFDPNKSHKPTIAKLGLVQSEPWLSQRYSGKWDTTCGLRKHKLLTNDRRVQCYGLPPRRLKEGWCHRMFLHST